jgi:hypothetical protein
MRSHEIQSHCVKGTLKISERRTQDRFGPLEARYESNRRGNRRPSPALAPHALSSRLDSGHGVRCASNFWVSAFAEGALSPADDVLDIAVASALVQLLGWHWEFLPAFLAELVPGVDPPAHQQLATRWWQNSWQSVLRNVPKDVISFRTAVRIHSRINMPDL